MDASVTPAQAFNRLREGNQRFAQNLRSVDAMASQARRDALVAGQAPFATVLSCSDSRAPSEILFDCGLGELFVVRVAGNIVAPSIVGSVEFASATFGTPLVVVMGHTGCGAVAATVSALASGERTVSPNIRDIVDRITPAVRALVVPNEEPAKVLARAVRANVDASANHLRTGSRILESMVRSGKLFVVGAEYSLETGLVTFFDEPPADAPQS